MDRPNEVWVSDITYLSSRSGWLYLVVFIDLFSRRVVGWCVSTSLAHETVVTALSRAVWQRRPQPGLMIHSDRGIQYCCDGFRKAVDAHQFVQSMSKKADCWDNAVSESFFKTLKTEWLYHVDLTDIDHAERELFEYIEMFYNNQRLYLLSEIARKNGGKVEARSWLPVGLRRDTYFGISLTSQEE